MIVGYNFVPPDSLSINGEARGPANELLRVIAKEMGVKIEFRFVPLARLLDELKSNRIDCINSIGSRGDPAIKINAAKPFMRTSPGLLVRNDSPIGAQATLDQLKGLVIGTKLQMALTETMETKDHFNFHWTNGDNAMENAVKMLASKRIDAVYSPRVGELLFFAAKNDLLQKVRATKLPDEPWDVFVAFSREGAKKFKQRYDEAMPKVLERKAFSTYWDESLGKDAELRPMAPLIRPFLVP